MSLPFTEEQFLDVFGSYNEALWPVVVATWLASLVVLIRLLRGALSSRTLAAFMALQWGWVGIVYHAGFFSAINAAAWVFAALFLVEALGFLQAAVTGREARIEFHPGLRKGVAVTLLAYALLYPALVIWSGFDFPRAPMSAVPCPLAIFTAGLLITVGPGFPRWLAVIPIVWAVIGGSAAGFFGVQPDYALPVAGAAMVINGLHASPSTVSVP